jgi:membrane-associated protease RseP (regulator of RpoE activity)
MDTRERSVDVEAGKAVESAGALDSSAQLMVVAQLRRQLADLMHVESHAVLKPPDGAISFRGHVEGDTEAVFEEVTRRFARVGYTGWLRERPEAGHEVIATKGVIERKPGRVWTNVVLFVATLFTVLFVGAEFALGYADVVPTEQLQSADEWMYWAVIMPLTHLHWGIPFAATLLGILLTHELSHYFVARRNGSPVSLPYFIPLPPVIMPSILGTMGAVIVQRAPMRSRRSAFDIGIAGPLGGLVIGIPLLILGLSLSSVGPPPPGVEVVSQEGNSLLYLALKYLVFGRVLPGNGEDVWLHPVAFAAWAGLLITMLNLIPVGQLDGGHVIYGLLGHRSRRIGVLLIGAMAMLGLGLLLTGNMAGGLWLVWALFNFSLNRRHPPPLDDATPLDRRRVVVGIAMLVLFCLLFIPAPLQTVVVQ